jgi:hypothetical protein
MQNDKVTTKNLRIFGLIWSLILLFLARKFVALSLVFGFLSFLFLFTALVCPWVYTTIGIYQNWIKFGNSLGKINSFLIITILFYGLFTPIGLVLRILKKDLLKKKIDTSASSYFIERKTQPGSMINQF